VFPLPSSQLSEREAGLLESVYKKNRRHQFRTSLPEKDRSLPYRVIPDTSEVLSFVKTRETRHGDWQRVSLADTVSLMDSLQDMIDAFAGFRLTVKLAVKLSHLVAPNPRPAKIGEGYASPGNPLLISW
jgi:hypothetical protein